MPVLVPEIKGIIPTVAYSMHKAVRIYPDSQLQSRIWVIIRTDGYKEQSWNQI